MRKLLALGVLVVLPACGGSNSTPAAPAPPPPTPTPPPNFSGSYSGTMLYNVQGLAEVRVPSRITVTHTGNNLDFSNLTITVPTGASIAYGMGNATLNGNTFTGTHAYNSSGCARIDVQTSGRFAGNLMNLTAVLTSSEPRECARSELRGELSR